MLPEAKQQLRQIHIHYPEETHFKNIQQLTFGGDNAEAYWSYDSKYIVFQRTNPKEGLNCDQIFIGKVPQNPVINLNISMISSGKGRTPVLFLQKTANILYMHPLTWAVILSAGSGQEQIW